MPTTGEELLPRPGGDFKSLTRKYGVFTDGSLTPEEDVFGWVDANAPGTINGLFLNNISLEETEAEDQWEATAHYDELSEPAPPPASGTMEYRFNFQAQGGHFYQSLGTILYATVLGSNTDPTVVLARQFKGAINVVSDGGKLRCEGFQVDPPAETFTLSYYPVNAVVTEEYQQIVEGLCGKVNNYEFRGKPAGSLMLVRVSGGIRTNEDWQIEFGFGYVPNATDIPVGNDILIPEKDGLDLLWAYYGDEKDDDAKAIVKQPKSAYVERVWERGTFDELNLPS